MKTPIIFTILAAFTLGTHAATHPAQFPPHDGKPVHVSRDADAGEKGKDRPSGRVSHEAWA